MEHKNELHQHIYQIIHTTTDGEFSNYPENAFIITGDNNKLTIAELDNQDLRRTQNTAI